MADSRFDVVIVGGGHNGLVAATYLAQAGRRVRLLERLDHVGGAAVSAHPFDGIDARLSRYSYLVSLMPRRILDDLGARVRLARRRYSSYTPDPATGGRTGLLIGPESTFSAIGAGADEAGFGEFYRRCHSVTSRLWPTLIEPLRTRAEVYRKVVADGGPDAAAAWHAMIERPIGEAITALDNGTASLTDLLNQARTPLAGTVDQLGRLAPLLDQDKELLDISIKKAPANYRKVVRLGSYGSWINQYLCGLSLRVTDLQGRTAYFPWIIQHTGRCAEP